MITPLTESMLGIVSGKPTEPPRVGLVGRMGSDEVAGWDIAIGIGGGPLEDDMRRAEHSSSASANGERRFYKEKTKGQRKREYR